MKLLNSPILNGGAEAMRRSVLVSVCALIVGFGGSALAQDVIQNPQWLVKPKVDDLIRYYPAAAAKAKVTGSAVIVCSVAVEGTLHDCQVAGETPVGYGFGQSAVRISSLVRMTPKMVNGVPVEGPVAVPVNFAIPKNMLQKLADALSR